jgi:alanine dehydrogenase
MRAMLNQMCDLSAGAKRQVMTLIIDNHEVQQLLTMEDTIAALERACLQLAAQEAVCRPRIDIRIPTSNPARNYRWGTMEGGSTSG